MELAIDFGITNTDILVSNKTERIYSSIPSEEINDNFLKKIFDLTKLDSSKIKKIAVTGGKSANLNNTFKDIPILEVVARDGRPLVIVAEEVEGQLLAALIINRLRNNMKIAAVKAPAYGEERRHILEDLALVTGATFISNDSGIRLKDVKLPH